MKSKIRSYFSYVAILVACLLLPILISSFTGRAMAEDDPKEVWIKAWLESPAARDVSGKLVLFRFKDPMYVLQRKISWIPNPGQEQYLRVDAPIGFVTDLASIPRVFWSLLRPDGEYAYPAIIHDYLYWTQTTTRDVADQILKFGMQDFGIDTLTIGAIYNAVHLGGQGAWDDNTRLKAAGEKRILIDLPDDPRVTWDEWRRRPGVFGP